MSWRPQPWEFVLLAAAGYRLWHLLAEDTILDRPRAWLLHAGNWRPDSNQAPPRAYRDKLATWMTCPWCAGFWIVLTLWLLWVLWPGFTLAFSVPWALSAAVGVAAKHFED